MCALGTRAVGYRFGSSKAFGAAAWAEDVGREGGGEGLGGGLTIEVVNGMEAEDSPWDSNEGVSSRDGSSGKPGTDGNEWNPSNRRNGSCNPATTDFNPYRADSIDIADPFGDSTPSFNSRPCSRLSTVSRQDPISAPMASIFSLSSATSGSCPEGAGGRGSGDGAWDDDSELRVGRLLKSCDGEKARL